ncbi:SIT4 phosphatase-associated protein-domain-containing protein [Thamnocephalis sphaerospora]|uniref:SIT4 phosphatase-associated protein-domain-containing protein n=1 Tax=Thamnocephalis sphaerospora TaxID=78915 RepID=A0A4P9XSE7_9FUNG|nr:SIT4 phosphatase-associated protein-domain-containing protein [Thamnocephalis sphaerospora]|eukprot:RKP09045.1 SIT4 phosphatase-associated protein-domain-containing protein [Thamnocephalis sphaerospora]
MFWRFGFNPVSAVDQLLEKEDVTLEELMDEEDLLQECKSHNVRLIEYLSEPATLEKLLQYVIADGEDEKERFKYPYVASEVIACEIWSICELIVENRAIMNNFWSFLSRPAPLNPLQASYFSKVMGVLLQKKTVEVLAFIKGQPNVLDRFLEHMATSAVMDLLLKIISMEEIPDGQGIVEWLNQQGLMSALIGRMDPNNDPDVHATAAQVLLDIITISQSSNPEQPSIGTNSLIRELKSAACVTRLVDYMLDPKAPNSTSTLVNGVAIFIELIRRNYNDLEEEEDVTAPPPVDLSDLICVLIERLPEFKQLLMSPKSVSDAVDTTMGRRVPLGFERLRVCELFAELLHLSNMGLLNSLLASDTDSAAAQPAAKSETHPISVGAALKLKFIETGVLSTCLDLFFDFPWNNFLHTVVYDMVHQVLNLPLDVGCNRNLVVSLFCDAKITCRITSAQRTNDFNVEQPKGVRLGFMGHLTFIADQVVRLLERSTSELGAAIEPYCTAEDWQEYVSKTLRETKERDHEQLGGQRPSALAGMSMLNLVDNDDDDEEDDEDGERQASRNLASDQVCFDDGSALALSED